MPYCFKCGAKLEDGAEFCQVCGAPVRVIGESRTRTAARGRRGLPVWALVLIALLIAGVVIGLFFFVPVLPVDIHKDYSVPIQVGTQALNLTLNADIANVNVIFQDMPNSSVQLNTSMTGMTSLVYSAAAVSVSLNYSSSNNVLYVTSSINSPISSVKPFTLNVTANVYIDPDFNQIITIKTNVGGIRMQTVPRNTFDFLLLEATTGGIEVNFVPNVVLDGNVTIRTVTGGLDVSWHNVEVNHNISATIGATTGGIMMDVTQDSRVTADVALHVSTVTGGISYSMLLNGNVGATINSSVVTGGINVVTQSGFTGDKSFLKSNNYPAPGNFVTTLRTTTGGITIDAEQRPGAGA